MNYEENIGKRCRKTSRRDNTIAPKPFKSTFQVNTIKGVTINEHTGKPAYTFFEDDSCVHCHQVLILD